MTLDDLWPQIPEHPQCTPTQGSLHASFIKIPQGIFDKKHFEAIVNRYTDTQMDR